MREPGDPVPRVATVAPSAGRAYRWFVDGERGRALQSIRSARATVIPSGPRT